MSQRLDPDPQALLYRILQSPGFRESPPHQGLLQYICGQSQAGEFDTLYEHDIGVALYGLPPGYDVNEQPFVRQTADEVRAMLADYFKRHGRREPIRLVIPKAEYRAFFYEAPADERGPEAIAALDQFWAPYLQGAGRNFLVHGELPDGVIAIQEAYALVKVASLFEKRECPLEIRAVYSFEAQDLKGVNLILIGTPEKHSLLKVAAGELPESATVRRIPASPEHGVITIVTAPDPEGVLKGAVFITAEDILARIREKAFGDTAFPPEFDLKISG